MDVALGALFAFGAVLLWGTADFMIQRSTRRIGDWEILFLIVLFGTIILTPFVYQDVFKYVDVLRNLLILLTVSVVIFFAALVDFEALKKGKIVVVEPVLVMEIPVVLFLSLFFIDETLTTLESLLVIIIITGLILISIESNFLKSKKLEKGVFLAAAAAILLGASDFLVGFGARATSPLMVNWFLSINLLVYTLLYLLLTGKMHKLFRDVRKMPGLILATCALDNLAWISYAFATIFIPITIAVAISENYIAVAALLGLFISREKILAHQKIGLVVALSAAVILALIV